MESNSYKIGGKNISSKINKSHVTWFSLCATLLGVSSTDIYISSLPQMVTDFATSPSMINLTISCYTLAMALGGLYIGILSNRFGRRPTLLSGIALYIISSFFIAHTSSVTLMITMRILQGTACSAIAVITRVIFKDIMDAKEQIHANGIQVMGIVISPAVAPSIGAFMAAHFGWQSCFELSSFLGIFLLITGWFIIKETNSTPVNKLESPSKYIAAYISIFTNKTQRSLLMIIGFSFASYFVFIGISSYLYINKLGISPINYSYIFIIIAIGYFAGNSLMMYLNKNSHPTDKIIYKGLLISVAGLILIIAAVFVSSKILIILLLTSGVLIMRGGSALIIAPTQVKLLEEAKEQGALAVGLAQFTQFALSSIAASLVVMFHEVPLAGMVIMTVISFLPVILANKWSRIN